MPDPALLDQYRQAPSSVPNVDALAQYRGTRELRPGEDWTNPIQDEHPDMGMFSRIGLKTFADAGPETMIKNLENKGFEARHRGGMRFSLRHPGEKDWYVLDPEQFELLDDITDFIPGLLFPAAGTVTAGAKGAAIGGTTLGPAGAVVGGIVGGAGGGAAGEALKMGAGKALGYEYAPEEAGEKIAMEAKLGAVSQAAAPVLQVAGGAAKRALVGEAGEVAARNLAKKEAYKRAVAATPEGAPFPAAPVLEEVAEEGLLPKAARKWREARDVKTVLEGPKRKAREEFADTAGKIIDEAFAETEGVSAKELRKRAKQLQERIAKAEAKGEDTTQLLERAKRVNEALEVEQTFAAGEKEVVTAGRGVTAAEKKVGAARGGHDKIAAKIGDLQGEIATKQAKLDRAAAKDVASFEVQLNDLQREIGRWDSWTKEYKRLKRAIPRVEKKLENARAGVAIETEEIAALKKGLPKLKAQLEKAKRAKRTAAKALEKARETAKVTTVPEVEPLAKSAFIKNLAEDAGIPTTSKTGAQIVKALDELITDKRYAEYLRSGQDPAVREAIDRQVRSVINELAPDEEFFVKFARRGEKGVEVAPEERYFREMTATKDIPLDPEAWRNATRDVEGKTLQELRGVLDEAGWKGAVPDSIEGITEALYRARTEGINGVGMSYDPASKQLIGAESRGAGAVSDVELRAAGEPSRRVFGAPETVELQAGGKKIPIGQEFAQQAVEKMGPVQRAVVKPPGIVREAGRGLERLRRGAAGTFEKAADVAGLPGKAYDVALKKFREVVTPGEAYQPGAGMFTGPIGGLGLAYAVGAGPAVGKAILTGFASKIAARGLRAISRAIMADPRALMALAKKATGPIAQKLQIPLTVLQRRGNQAYRASIFTMLHDPEVRAYLQGLEKKKEKNE